MAEAIGVASGLLALATFAFDSSISLYEMVKSFQYHPMQVRDLLEELEALITVLGPLTEIVQSTTQDLTILDLPLKRCGCACKEFQLEITKYLSHSGKNRLSFRDWAKMRYMRDDIDGFRRLLAGYKLTISIALTDANLRKSSVTAEALAAHKDLIETARDDLEALLGKIDEKLDCILGQAVTKSDSDILDLHQIQEERLSTEKCLQLCLHLSQHIAQIPLSSQDSNSSKYLDSNNLSETITKESLAVTAARLEKHMQDIIDRLLISSKKDPGSQDDLADLTRLRDEWETTRQCIDVCLKADNYLKENSTVTKNYGTDDALQFMVSTNGKILHGKKQGFGWRTRQIGGYLNDASLQQLCQDMTSRHLSVAEKEGSLTQDDPKFTTPGQKQAVPAE
ncbi:hypothetical protein BGW36DRAFT_357365 [Talaromyces proteolyticus]|uniref:Azaphilone pigments biosynthesis cluster protein L N-terminal domain-containing protein n=1 Tax=Talaromyces proteolyticus TaxID=1131652 RepID=A0AAD4Q0E6_9EURO|nr:uncharacterized protein BGW36DRAFT_357365 [Talaromyces proteolyticus]KAH8700714.1 hypothetical protein BGW36DRAFT_357365 [Talaromyces proteolyticus]